MNERALAIWKPGALNRQLDSRDLSNQSVSDRGAVVSREEYTYRIHNLPVNWGKAMEPAIHLFLGKIGVQNAFFRVVKSFELPSKQSWHTRRFDVDISVGPPLKETLDSPAFRLALLLSNEKQSLTNSSEYITVSPVLTPRESAIRSLLEGVCSLLNSKKAFERFSVVGETIVFQSFHNLKKILTIDDIYQYHRDEYMEVITNCSEEDYKEIKAWLEEGVSPSLRKGVETDQQPEKTQPGQKAESEHELKLGSNCNKNEAYLFRYTIQNFAADCVTEATVTRLFSHLGFPNGIDFKIVSFAKKTEKHYQTRLDFKKRTHHFIRSPRFQQLVSQFNEGKQKSERLIVSSSRTPREAAILEVLEGVCHILNEAVEPAKYSVVVKKLEIRRVQPNTMTVVMDTFEVYCKHRNEYLQVLKNTGEEVQEEMGKWLEETKSPREGGGTVNKKNTILIMNGICKILNSQNPKYRYSVKKGRLRVCGADKKWSHFTYEQAIRKFPNELKQFFENCNPKIRKSFEKWAEPRKRKANEEVHGPAAKKSA